MVAISRLGPWLMLSKLIAGGSVLELLHSVLRASLVSFRSLKVLDILLRHLVSDVFRLPNCERNDSQCRICRRSGCELAAVLNK